MDTATLGRADTSRFVALFGGWGFRLLALVAIVPLVARTWGTDGAALVLWAGMAEAAVAAVMQTWAGAVAARVRALVATGDHARLRRTTTTALAAAAVVSVCLALLAYVGGPWLAWQLAKYARHPQALQGATGWLVAELALLPLLMTSAAVAGGLVGPRLADRLRGWLGLGAVAALGVTAPSAGLEQWARLSAAVAALVLLWLAIVLVRQGALRGAGLAWSELQALLRAVPAVPSGANLWSLPVLAATLLLGAQLGLASHFADLALVALTVALGNWGSDLARRMAPEVDIASPSDDPYRLRWRFGRHFDAANLVAVGMLIVLLCYLGLASRLWLAKLGPVAAPVEWLGLWAGGVAPSRVLGEQVVRQDQGAPRLAVHLGELVVVVAANGLVGGDATAVMVAVALAVRWLVLLALALPAICKHFHISYTRMTYGTFWRFALVALPASTTGLVFAAFRPPVAGREWALQLAIVGILYLVPAFTAWNLLDTRRDRNA
ncbi:MAG: hypothetical protein HY902_13200 [Deltaproteobacteria bacterium]|nr:hypothetical protein [Deltaproteobacteria bacterium]